MLVEAAGVAHSQPGHRLAEDRPSHREAQNAGKLETVSEIGRVTTLDKSMRMGATRWASSFKFAHLHTRRSAAYLSIEPPVTVPKANCTSDRCLLVYRFASCMDRNKLSYPGAPRSRTPGPPPPQDAIRGDVK